MGRRQLLKALATLSFLALALVPCAVRATPRTDASTFKVVGYIGEWDKQCAGCRRLSANLLSQITVLNYAFASPQGDICSLGEPKLDAKDDFTVIRAAKQANPHLEVVLSLGGAGATNFASAVATQSKINTLVKNCVKLMRVTYPGVFDGIDVDWEYPSNARQKADFTLLVSAFRTALGSAAPVTVAVAPYFSVDWKSVTPLLSWVNLMTYDLHGPWDSRTNFLAPVNADPKDPQHVSNNSVTAAVTTMLQKYGLPPAKLVLGIPFYGYAYAHVGPAHHGLYQKFKGVWGGNGGTQMYWQILGNLLAKDHFVEHGPNATAQEPWVYRAGKKGNGVFVNFDDVGSIAAKAALIKSRSLGGAMIWDIAFDTASPTTSLLTAIDTDLGEN